MVETKNAEVTDPVGYIQSAIVHELMENSYCPLAGLLQDLLAMYQGGDKQALDFALKIAHESLDPKKPGIVSKIASIFRGS